MQSCLWLYFPDSGGDESEPLVLRSSSNVLYCTFFRVPPSIAPVLTSSRPLGDRTCRHHPMRKSHGVTVDGVSTAQYCPLLRIGTWYMGNVLENTQYG